MAVLLMLPFFWKDVRKATRRDWLHGLILGVLYYLCQATQVWGLLYTTPANGSFITAAYVVLVPFTSWMILKQKAEKTVFLALPLCVAGLYVLNMAPGEGLQMNLGNLITLGCALCWSFQVTCITWCGRTTKTTLLTILPLMFASAISGCVALFSGGFSMEGVAVGKFFGTVVLLVLFPTIGSGLCQSYAQKFVPPAKAAVIYTIESVFACTLSVVLGYDQPSVRLFLGGALIVSAILVTEVKLPGKKRKEEVTNESC
jgi:drug/metabolite transporter (DMT)-like permease